MRSSTDWIQPTQTGCLLRVYIQPGASRTEMVNVRKDPEGTRLKIKIAAPPQDGEANAELQSFLCERLGVAKACVQLVRGEKSRNKDVAVAGLGVHDAMNRLAVPLK